MRPERLRPQFDDASWNLMKSSWAGEPSERPLLGEVQSKLQDIYTKALAKREAEGGGGGGAKEQQNLKSDTL